MRTRTLGKRLLRNCARRVKACIPLKIEGIGELKRACPLCSPMGILLEGFFGPVRKLPKIIIAKILPLCYYLPIIILGT